MALINCPECQKEISDQATSCPNCGCPINYNSLASSQIETLGKNNKDKLLSRTSVVGLVLGLFFLGCSSIIYYEMGHATETNEEYYLLLSNGLKSISFIMVLVSLLLLGVNIFFIAKPKVVNCYMALGALIVDIVCVVLFWHSLIIVNDVLGSSGLSLIEKLFFIFPVLGIIKTVSRIGRKPENKKSI